MRGIDFYKTLVLVSVCLHCAALFAEQAPSLAQQNLSASAYLVIDFNSQAVLAAHEGQTRVEPASLTKMMTAYLTFEALKHKHLSLTQAFNPSPKACKTEGSKMFLSVGTPATVDALLHGLIVHSGNDAAITLAESISGSEAAFALQMNQTAARLGMAHTHFMNATGLPDAQHYSTAQDLAQLASAIIRDFPADYARLYALKSYTYNGITQANRNRLLWLDATVDGMKTGHTESAGYCLIASAKRGETRHISVVLGTASDAARAVESQQLLNASFAQFSTHLLYAKNQAVHTYALWHGVEHALKATLAAPLFVTVPQGQYAQLHIKATTQEPLFAPIAARQVLGKLTVYLGESVLAERELVAQKSIAQAGFFSRRWDDLQLWWAK